ncbi:transcriptional regulator [Leucobacter komagatae]|uniref:transcriptional regulator n=1 Tax=Leucobacter komagatae TaxID=55969 RepID=UPI000A06FBD1|nr:transcriptional regulator [Leucobacter komagatae]
MAKAVFNELIHGSIRLRVCGLLRAVEHLDFSVLRETVDVSDATLSKHLMALIDAEYVSSSKAASRERQDVRRITWLSPTASGPAAFDGHVTALREITGDTSSPKSPGYISGSTRWTFSRQVGPNAIRPEASPSPPHRC